MSLKPTDYYKQFFPVRKHRWVIRKQLLVAKIIAGLSPDVTDQMECSEFDDYYSEIEQYLKKMKEENGAG